MDDTNPSGHDLRRPQNAHFIRLDELMRWP